jgi:maleate isomerase
MDIREPGWRGRIGVIQPAPGLMLEHEWARLLPAGVAAPFTRVPLAGGEPHDYLTMADLSPDAAATLANAGAGVIAYACGVGSMHQGPARESLLMQTLAAAAGGRVVVGMGQAAVAAMRHLEAHRIAVLTPYSDTVNELVTEYLLACGLEVSGIYKLPVANAIAAAGLKPAQAIAAALAALHESPQADLLWSACSNVRSLEVIAAVERASGRLMVSSNQALLWHCLSTLGVQTNDAYGGHLATEPGSQTLSPNLSKRIS